MRQHKRILDESYYAFEDVSEAEEVKDSEVRERTYLNLSDVKDLYVTLNGSTKGWTRFSQSAKKVATRRNPEDERSYFIFRNESALFEVFQEFLGKELEIRNIASWGELMQYIS